MKNKYAITIDVETEYPADVILKNVRDALEQFYRHTHNDWIKDYRIEQTGTVEPTEPVDLRALLLWEIVNCWYQDVALAVRHAARAVAHVQRPLNDAELFEIAADLREAQQLGHINCAPMDGSWLDTVMIANDSILALNGDRPDDLQNGFESWVDEGYGPVGDLVETAHLFLFATGPLPAKRYEYKKES